MLVLGQASTTSSYQIDKATGISSGNIINVHKGKLGGAQNYNFGQKISGDINFQKLVRHKRFLYDNDNNDAIEDWRDAFDDTIDYKRDLFEYWADGARTFLETFFPCGVTDSCDKDEDTPMPTPMKNPMYVKKHTYYKKP